MRRLLLLLALGLAGCSDDFSQLLTIVVPPEVGTIAQGRHFVAVFGYDPNVADAGATLLTEIQVPFAHVTGRQTRRTVPLKTRVPRGHRVYLAVASCEYTIEGAYHVLWDGQEGTGTPREVRMQRVPTPVPCEQLWGSVQSSIP